MKPREFKISFIDEGHRGYAVVSGMHQEQVLPYIRHQTVTLHVREVMPKTSIFTKCIVCDHPKGDHTYDEGACRPGFKCDCEHFDPGPEPVEKDEK